MGFREVVGPVVAAETRRGRAEEEEGEGGRASRWNEEGSEGEEGGKEVDMVMKRMREGYPTALIR